MDKKQETALIASRVAKELRDGDVVNLGIGLPTQVANYLPRDIEVHMTSENGIAGFSGAPEEGKENPDLINAGGGFISEIKGTSYFDSATSFSIVRGGHLDVTVLGALEVDQLGNIANWIIPGKLVPGMGGAMDLCVGAKRVIASMKHVDKKGNSKILKKCSLPLTAKGRVSLIVTEMAVMEVTSEGLVLREVADGTSVQEVVNATEADLIIPEKIRTFRLPS